MATRLVTMSLEDSAKILQGYKDGEGVPGICAKCCYKFGSRWCQKGQIRDPACVQVGSQGIVFGYFIK